LAPPTNQATLSARGRQAQPVNAPSQFPLTRKYIDLP
jgi:hypothetical protein